MLKTSDPGRPIAGEYLDYFDAYISLVGDGSILEILEKQISMIPASMAAVPDDQIDCLHQPYTWTIKQVIGHCIDTERIFGYRACRFAAGDSTPVPGFDQDTYVDNTDYQDVTLGELTNELVLVRQANLAMLQRQTPETWMCNGTADGKNMTVRAAAYVMAGHILHHFKIIEARLA